MAMNIIEFMKSEPGIRLSNGKRWMVADDMSGGWAVYEHIIGKRQAESLYEGDDLEVALLMLKGDF
jgi:hypothetical protein